MRCRSKRGRGRVRRTNGSILAVVGSLGVALCPAVALAGHPLESDDVGTIGAQGVELSLSTGVGGGSGEGTSFGLGLSLHVGVTDILNVGANMALESLVGRDGSLEAGMADPVLDAKVRLIESNEAAPGIALRVDYKPSTATNDESTGHDVGLLGVATWSSDPVEVNVNAGAYGRGIGSGDEHAGFYGSTTAMVEVFDGVSVGAEGVTEVRHDGTVDRVSGLGGVIWGVTEDSALSLGAGGVWSPEGQPEWFGTLGYTITFQSGQGLPDRSLSE